mmetsp:Transcript_36452/g.41690  ORF Transcript_36452/g.41690 Transcript_36452/m.41690 type:complete len:416 (+) Transcript_36452:63-1310(+)
MYRRDTRNNTVYSPTPTPTPTPLTECTTTIADADDDADENDDAAEPLVLHVIFIRHGRTIDNEQGVISGGDADPDLTPEGREQAQQSHTVYQALLATGIVTDQTPVYTTDRKRALDTATLFTGRERERDCDRDEQEQEQTEQKHTNTFIIDPRLLERKLGDWDTILTERFQKEIKAIPGFSPPAEETPREHKSQVFACLDERIAEIQRVAPTPTDTQQGRQCRQPSTLIIVSHGGTTRRIATYFGIEEGLEVHNAVPHHAVSQDGGTTWEVTRCRVDGHGHLYEEVLPQKLPVVPTEQQQQQPRTMESIFVEDASYVSLSEDYVLTIQLHQNKTTTTTTTPKNKEALIAALVTDLGQLLIGKSYTTNNSSAIRVLEKEEAEEGGTSSVVQIVVTLNKVQAEIVQQFATLKGIEFK